MTGEVYKVSITFLVCLIISVFWPCTLIKKGTLLMFVSVLLNFDYTIPNCHGPSPYAIAWYLIFTNPIE